MLTINTGKITKLAGRWWNTGWLHPDRCGWLNRSSSRSGQIGDPQSGPKRVTRVWLSWQGYVRVSTARAASRCSRSGRTSGPLSTGCLSLFALSRSCARATQFVAAAFASFIRNAVVELPRYRARRVSVWFDFWRCANLKNCRFTYNCEDLKLTK